MWLPFQKSLAELLSETIVGLVPYDLLAPLQDLYLVDIEGIALWSARAMVSLDDLFFLVLVSVDYFP